MKAPIFVFRQWMKHRIASEFNEISGRYVEFPEDEFYVPETFRRQAKVNKQGSEGAVEGAEAAQAQELFLAACRNAVQQVQSPASPWACAGNRPGACCPWACTPRCTGPSASRPRPTSSACAPTATPSGRSSRYAHAVRQVVEAVFPVGLKALLSEGRA